MLSPTACNVLSPNVLVTNEEERFLKKLNARKMSVKSSSIGIIIIINWIIIIDRIIAYCLICTNPYLYPHILKFYLPAGY